MLLYNYTYVTTLYKFKDFVQNGKNIAVIFKVFNKNSINLNYYFMVHDTIIV